MNCSIKRIVVVCTDRGLGDTILTTPVIQALGEVLPDTHLDVWVNPKWRYVIEGFSVVSSILDVRFRPKGLTLLHLLMTLRRYQSDAILILNHSLRFARIAFWAKVPIRAGRVDSSCLTGSLARLLTHPAPLQPFMHRVEHNLSVAEAILNRKLPRYPLIFAPARPASLPSQLQPLPEGSYVVIHIGTGGNQPYWVPERFAEVGIYLAQKYRLIPVLSGSKSDCELAKRCINRLCVPYINLVGEVTIPELAEVIRRARMLISVDTGVVHLAAAVGTPCITMFFRKDNPPYRWVAWQVPNRVVVPSRYCERCVTRCQINQPYPLMCVNSLHVDQVIEAIDFMIK